MKVRCYVCNKDYDVNVNEDKLQNWIDAGKPSHIQNVFPELSDSERELLISNTCDTCFNNMFLGLEDE